jgi:hypothetical protein
MYTSTGGEREKKNGNPIAILFNLTKAYDFINHGILPAKLNSYGVILLVSSGFSLLLLFFVFST